MIDRQTMSPRQRVSLALNHEVPDRVPIDLGGFQTGIHRKAYAALLEHLGICDEITTMDPVQQLGPECTTADLDSSGFTDGTDIGILKGCMSGANTPVDPHCAD